MAAVGLTSAEQPLEVQQLQKPKEASGAGRPTATSRALGERAAGCDKNKQQPRRRDGDGGGGTSEARGAADDDKDDKEDGRREPRLTQAEHGEHCEMGAQVEPIGGGEGAARAAEFKLPATSQHFATATTTTAESGAGGAHMTTTSADEPRRRAPQRKASVFSFDGFPSLDELDQAALKQHARQLSSSTGDLAAAAASARLAPSKSASDQELELEQDQEREQDDQMIAVTAAARREQEAGGEREQERQQVMIETAGKTAGGGGGGGETALGAGAAKSAASPRRSTRSDTLGSTGSSRASSCDEPTIVARGAKPLAKPLAQMGQRAGCEGPKGAPALDGLPRAIESSTSSLDSIASEKAPAAAVVAAVVAPSEPPPLPVTAAQSAPAEEAPVPMEVVEQELEEDEGEGEEEDEESMEDEGLEAPSLGGNKRQPASRRRRRRLSSVSSNGSNSSADDVFESTTTGGGGRGAEPTCEAKLGALASRAGNLPPPFESILSKLKRDSIPDANAIRQHIDKLISQNEAIIENWSQVSIRSYNSTAAGATATTTTSTSTSTSTPSGSSNAGSSLASPKSLKSAAGGADLKTPPALTQAALQPQPQQLQQLQQPQPPPRQRPSKQRWSTTALCQGNVFSQRQQLEELRLQHSRNQLASLAAPSGDSLKATRDSLSQFVGARLRKRSYNLGVACAAAAAQATNNPASQNNNNNNNNNGNQINQNSQNQDQNSVGGGGDAGGASGAAHAPLQARRAPVRQTSDVSGLHPMLLTQAASSALFGAQPAELLAAGRHPLEQPQQFAFGLQQADLQPQQQQPQQNRLPASLASSPKPMVPANTFADVQNFLSSRFSLEAQRPAGELPPTCHFNQPPAAPVDNHLALKFKPDEPQGLLPMAGRAPSAFVVQRTDELRAMASLLAAQQRQQQLLEEQLCQQQQQRRRHQETAAGGDIPAALLDYYKLQLQQQALEHQANLSRLAALEAEFQQQQQLNARLLATTIQQQQQQQQQLPVALMQQPLECLGERQKRESQLLNEFLAKMILSRGAGDERRASTSGGGGGGGADEALASLDQRVAPIVRHSCDEEAAAGEAGEEEERQRGRRPSEMFTQPLDSATPAHRCDACDISFWTRDLLNYHLMTSCSARTGPEPARPLAFNFAQPNGFDQLTAAAAAAASSSLAMSPINGLDMTSGRQHNGLAAGAFQLPPAAHSKSASPPPRRRTYHEMEAPSQALLQIPAKHQAQALLLGAAADDEQQRRFARSPLALDKQALVAPKSPHKSRKSAELAWQQRLDELCLLKQQLLTAGGAGAAAAAAAELHPRQASSSGSAAGELQASSLPIKKRKISEPNMRY